MTALDRLDRLRALYMMALANARIAETGAVQIDDLISTWPHGHRLIVIPVTHRLRQTAQRYRVKANRANAAIGMLLKRHPDLTAAARGPE